jgi:hypothetical protein
VSYLVLAFFAAGLPNAVGLIFSSVDGASPLEAGGLDERVPRLTRFPTAIVPPVVAEPVVRIAVEGTVHRPIPEIAEALQKAENRADTAENPQGAWEG